MVQEENPFQDISYLELSCNHLVRGGGGSGSGADVFLRYVLSKALVPILFRGAEPL